MIAGLLPEVSGGLTDPQLLTALRQRYALIEARADAVLDRDLTGNAPWIRGPRDPAADPARWRATARLIAAYRDRWDITDPSAMGLASDRSAAFPSTPTTAASAPRSPRCSDQRPARPHRPGSGPRCRTGGRGL